MRWLEKVLAWWRGPNVVSPQWLSEHRRIAGQDIPIIAVWRSPKEIAEMERQ